MPWRAWGIRRRSRTERRAQKVRQICAKWAVTGAFAMPASRRLGAYEDRQREAEDGAAAALWAAFDPDLSAVRFNEASHDRQTQA